MRARYKNMLLKTLVLGSLLNASAYAQDNDKNPKDAKPKPSERSAAMQPVGAPPAEHQADRPPQIETLIDFAGILTPPGKFIVEPSFQYAQTSISRVAVEGITVTPALLIGKLDIQDLSRDSYIAALTLRYGVSSRMELEARIPYSWRSESLSSRPANDAAAAPILTETSGHGLGDVEFAGHYQLNRGRDMPFFIANLRVKSTTGKGPFDVAQDPNTGLLQSLPTGSGFWSMQPSLTAIYPSDPAVLYGNLSYLRNFERDYGGSIGKIQPGNAIGFSFGMGLSLNEKTSFSTGYDHNIVSKPTQNGAVIPNSRTLNIGSLLLGYSYRINKNSAINLNLAAGLTRDAPNVQLTFRVPFTF